MSDPVRLDYEGPACINYYDGCYPELDIGPAEQILRWGFARSVGEQLHELVGKIDEGESFRSFTRVRIAIEVLDASPVTKPPDPLEVLEGPDAPDKQLS